jgi:hypothetical protein
MIPTHRGERATASNVARGDAMIPTAFAIVSFTALLDAFLFGDVAFRRPLVQVGRGAAVLSSSAIQAAQNGNDPECTSAES